MATSGLRIAGLDTEDLSTQSPPETEELPYEPVLYRVPRRYGRSLEGRS